MAEPVTPRRRPVLQAFVSLVVAAILVGVTTLLRMALEPQLGAMSPLMLYVAAVLVAGLIRGAFCGALVMFAGGALGMRLFVMPHHVAAPGSMISLMIFWGVSAAVLATANELRVQMSHAMARLSAALRRSGRAA